VADRLAVVEPPAADGERARLALDRAGPATGGAGLLVAQGLGLLLEAGLQGARGQAGGRGLGDLLHGVEVDVEPGASVAEGAAGDDFAPLRGEGVDFLEFLRRDGPSRHGASCAGVTGERALGLLLSGYESRLGRAKRFMASTMDRFSSDLTTRAARE
jgi:hypothetical protein